MKKIILSFALFLSFGFATQVSAQSTKNQCPTVQTQADYDQCCYFTYADNMELCEAYRTNLEKAAEKTATPVPGTVGAPVTNPVNADNGYSGNPAVSPQSSSPQLAACSAIKFKSLLDMLVWVKCVITSIIIPLIFTLAFLFFLWNVFRFIQSSDKKDKDEAKERMVWGIIALFVMLSVWGIIALLGTTLGLSPSVPLLQTTYLDPAKASK